MTETRRKSGGEPRRPLWSRSWQETPEHLVRDMRRDVSLDCGWGRLVFAQTFTDTSDVIGLLGDEQDRPVGAGAELLGDEVIGLAGGRVGVRAATGR